MSDAYRESVVLPGDDVTCLVSFAPSPLRLGAGLHVRDAGIFATRAGVLQHLEPNRFFVWSSARRFSPAVGDTVVGVVRDRLADAYRVRLHGTSLALLPVLAFDGATRRNKPSLAIGALVFARIVACSKHMEPELSCTAPAGTPKKDWMTGAAVFGELAAGRLAHVPLGLARRLLDPSCALLATLGRALSFQAAVGLNGLVWISGETDAATAAICAALEAATSLDEDECAALAERTIADAKK